MADLAAHIKVLESENDLLRERIRQLEAELGMCMDIPPVFGLTPRENRLLSTLVSRDLCTKDTLMHALYALAHDREVPDVKIVDVFVCKMRKKLRPFGIDITTIWGQGWLMKPEDKQTVHSIIASVRVAA